MGKIDLNDETDKIEFNKVHECTSKTWIRIVDEDNITLTVDSESAIVKGLLRVLQIGFNNEEKNIYSAYFAGGWYMYME